MLYFSTITQLEDVLGLRRNIVVFNLVSIIALNCFVKNGTQIVIFYYHNFAILQVTFMYIKLLKIKKYASMRVGDILNTKVSLNITSSFQGHAIRF